MEPNRKHAQARTRVSTARDKHILWGALGVLGLLATLALSGMARADEDQKIISSHGYSFYGNLKYPADYPHFDYVNPEAPKGGELAIAFVGTLDSMNAASRQGRAHLFSIMMYESLLGEAPGGGAAPADTYGEYYCLLCERLEYPEDRSWVKFHMRPEARFSDGTPVRAHDVAFSHNLLLDQGFKSYADSVRKLVPKVEVIDDHTIKFYFADGVSRRTLIEQVGGVPVWSEKWYEETGAKLNESRLENSPGSGAYMVDTVDVTRRIVLKRNPDYWGNDLPFNVGRNNYDSLRVEIFGDSAASFEAFKAGEYTFRAEGDSRIWATQYDFPKVQSGAVVQKELRNGAPPTPTGIIFNLASDQLKDRRVREAVALGYNFEWTNESLQYGLFKQRASFSQGTPVMATDAPTGIELELLQSLGDIVPEEMLTEPARMPHTSNPETLRDRRNLRKAMRLLDDAGWEVGDDGLRRNADGEVLKLNFLFNSSASPTLTGVMENFVSNVSDMGIDITLERVDPSQFTSRERDRDYDLIYDSYSAFIGTGTGLEQRFGSEDAAFSLFNPAGLASPLIDKIIAVSLRAETQEEETASMMALDRALRHEFFMVPVWYNPNHWVAYYDMYEHPPVIPPYNLGYLDFWWVNEDKAADLKASGALR
ncbi:ABC transporter substrate-binding protein [Tateyamaria omphalii]|uniref:extracellular solute-binding protein n=1 Tax=Tateyamaria omphalii TaxID=299262 RepID=UPI00167AD98F|nr:extracellular solute-binding protein [Tateyamaria omphalii]GGX43757.1 ABC transporter substrate-binding protein [Tateyamaria omphalii]